MLHIFAKKCAIHCLCLGYRIQRVRSGRSVRDRTGCVRKNSRFKVQDSKFLKPV